MKHLSLNLLIVCLILLNCYITSTEIKSLNYDLAPENSSSIKKKTTVSLKDALKNLDKFRKPNMKKSSKSKERTSSKANGVNKKSNTKKSIKEKPKREIKVVHVTDPKVVSRNVHWLSVRLISKLLIKLGDRREIDEIQQDLIKNCPNQNVIPKIRDEVINFKVVVATVGKEKGVKAAVSIENWKNIIEAITKACPAVVEKSVGYKWIAKAKANLQKDQNGKFEKIQTKTELSIHRMAVFLRVTEKVIETKIAEIKEALRKQKEAEKAFRLKIMRARKAEAERRRKAKLAEKKKKDEEARKKKKKGGRSKKQKVKASNNSTISNNSTLSINSAAKKASFLEIFTQLFRSESETEDTPKKTKSNKKKSKLNKNGKNTKSSRKTSGPNKKSKKVSASSRSTNSTTSSEVKPEPFYVNVVRTPVNKDVAFNTPEQDEFVKKSGISKMKNMTLSNLIAKTLKYIARII